MSNRFSRNDDFGSSFLPEDYVAAKGETKANLLAVMLFSVVMFGVVSAFLFTNRRWESVKTERQRIVILYEQESQKIEQLKQLEHQRTQMLQKAAITTALIENVPRSVLLGDIVMRSPDDITLMEIELKSKRIIVKAPIPAASNKKTRSLRAKSGQTKTQTPTQPAAPKFEYRLSIIGVSQNNTQVADYLANLQDSELLDEVELEYITSTVESDVKLRKFKIVCRLRPDADARDLQVVKDMQDLVDEVESEMAGEPEGDQADGELTEGDPLEGEPTEGDPANGEVVDGAAPADPDKTQDEPVESVTDASDAKEEG